MVNLWLPSMGTRTMIFGFIRIKTMASFRRGRDTPSRLQRISGDESQRCCCLASAASDQKAALEHTSQTSADGKLTRAFCACVREINC
jgi:hypothetical protein